MDQGDAAGVRQYGGLEDLPRVHYGSVQGAYAHDVNAVDCVGRAEVDGEEHLPVCIGQESFDNRSQLSGLVIVLAP